MIIAGLLDFDFGYVHTTPARKLYWIGLLFTHKNSDFGAISVKRSEAVPSRSLKRRVTYNGIGVHTMQIAIRVVTKALPDRASVYT